MSDTETRDAGSDQLRVIRALLAKAEATQYPAEAEAFMAKVAELIARTGIDEALVWAQVAPEARTAPIVATILLPAPYAARKAYLVDQIATSCGCQAVRDASPGGDGSQRISVVGFEGDVRRTELLTTSLLMQLTRDMLSLSPKYMSASETASWRRSFIMAFGSRIGERLAAERAAQSAERDAAEAAEAAASGKPAPTASTELVLVDREREVGQAFREHFPRIRTSKVSLGRSAAGASAGRNSASRADLGGRNLAGARAELAG